MSGLPPPELPPTPAEAEVIRQLRFLAAMVQVLCALLAILIIILLAWLLGIVPEGLFSPIVEVRV